MKNIHTIPTNKPSRLSILNSGKLNFGAEIMSSSNSKPQHIYITSDEEIKEGYYGLIGNKVGKIILTEDGYEFLFGKGVSYEHGDFYSLQKVCKKIILTTDQDLINDGVQSIDDEFLEWVVNNPSCDYVDVKYDKDVFPYGVETAKSYGWYKIIIPEKEGTMISDWLNEHGNPEIEKKVEREAILKYGEPKQETLEEAGKNTTKKYINEREKQTAYLEFIDGAKWQQERMYSEEEVHKILCKSHNAESTSIIANTLKKWLEQFKKK